MQNFSIRSATSFTAKSAISVALLVYVARKIDLFSIAGDVQSLRFPWLTLYLFQLAIIPPLGGLRWRLVLKTLGSSMGMWSTTRLFWIGMIFSQVLPSSSGGDAVRVVLAWREGVPFARSAHSVILERVVMLYTLIGLVALMQLTGMSEARLPDFTWIGPALLSIATLGLGVVLFGSELMAYLPKWKPIRALTDLSFDSRRLFLSPASLGIATWSLSTHLNIAVACLWLGKALGIALPLVDYVFFISLVTIITSLPLSIGGWGLREGAIVALFGKAGVSAHSALAFSILFGLGVGVISLAGLPFVSLKKASRQVRDHAELPCPPGVR